MDYEYKTQPYQHQNRVFLGSRDRAVYGLLMEMGTGKTKPTLDTAAWLWARDEIDLLIVAAPNGVHSNWTRREAKKHLPEWTNYRAAAWSSTMRAAEKKAVEDVLAPTSKFKGLRVLCLNLEAFGVPTRSYNAKAGELMKFCYTHFRCMLVVDESSNIKTPGAERTKRLLRLAPHMEYRRILTGTAMTNSPLDVYSQFRFLDKRILGFDNFYSFKNYYAEWDSAVTRGGQRYPILTGYRNLDELTERIHKYSFRVLKRDCLDLPEKVYSRRDLKMAPEQAAVYKRIEKEKLVLQGEEDTFLSTVLERLVRKQQVLGGFYPAEREDVPAQPIFDDPKRNPKVRELLGIIEEVGDAKMIIFARFRPELEMLHTLLGDRSVLYYGSTGAEEREKAIDRFQESPEIRFFLGSRAAMYGITLTAAEYVIFFSNSYRLDDRLQGEDRAHRAGLDHSVTYIDLLFPSTDDEKIVSALRRKKNIADIVNRDGTVAWI